jgi:elongation factor 1-alpha
MIGVEDDGNPLGLNLDEMRESLGTLFIMARNLNADLKINQVKKGISGHISEAKVRINELEGIKPDIKITMIGCEGSGKSTLLGVLISGKKDNGKGTSRQFVFRHKHEILDGRTSSISQ